MQLDIVEQEQVGLLYISGFRSLSKWGGGGEALKGSMVRGVPLSPSIIHDPNSFRFSQELALFLNSHHGIRFLFANTKTIHVVRASLTLALILRLPVRKDTLLKTVNSEIVYPF